MAPRILNLAERRAAQTALTRIVIYATLAVFVLPPPAFGSARSFRVYRRAHIIRLPRGCLLLRAHGQRQGFDKRIRLRNRVKRQQKSSLLRNSRSKLGRERVAHSRARSPPPGVAERAWRMAETLRSEVRETSGVKKSRQPPEKLLDLSDWVRGAMALREPKEETIGRDWRQFRSSGWSLPLAPSSLVNLWVTVLGEHGDYMEHLAPAIDTFVPSFGAPPTCNASGIRIDEIDST